ncbi:MAG: hypothetical protein QM532_04450 [Cyanobium sp. MAG06]|nr:hypothetical protein [Cyanobium sp. MAG06]
MTKETLKEQLLKLMILDNLPEEQYDKVKEIKLQVKDGNIFCGSIEFEDGKILSIG